MLLWSSWLPQVVVETMLRREWNRGWWRWGGEGLRFTFGMGWKIWPHAENVIDGCFQAWLVFAFGVGVEYIGCFLESSYFFHGFQHFGFGINFVHKKGTSPTAYSLKIRSHGRWWWQHGGTVIGEIWWLKLTPNPLQPKQNLVVALSGYCSLSLTICCQSQPTLCLRPGGDCASSNCLNICISYMIHEFNFFAQEQIILCVFTSERLQMTFWRNLFAYFASICDLTAAPHGEGMNAILWHIVAIWKLVRCVCFIGWPCGQILFQASLDLLCPLHLHTGWVCCTRFAALGVQFKSPKP